MPSSYSPSLRIELVADNEQSGVWGQTTNRNFSQVIEEALAGTAEVDVTAADVTLTAVNGATDQARRPFIRVIGTPVVARQVNVPDVNKNYLVQNTTGQTVTVKPTGQTGVAVLPGQSAFVRTRAGASAQGIEFVATVGGNLALPGTLSVAGAVLVTSTTAPQSSIRSGAAGSSAWLSVGRTSDEVLFGVSGGTNAIISGDVAGDSAIRLEAGTFRIGIGGSGKMSVNTYGVGIGVGRLALSGVPLMVKVDTNQNMGVITQGGVTTVAGFTDAGSSTGLKIAGNPLTFTGNGSAVHMTITNVGHVGFGRVPDVQPYEFAVSPSSAGTGGLRVIASPTLGTQLLITGPTYNYAGVGGNQAWLYSQGTMDLNVGPDGGGTLAFVQNGARRMQIGGGLINMGLPIYITNVGNENIRMSNDGAYLSFYNSAGTTRTGYFQSNASGNTVIARETAGNIEFIAGGATRFLIASDGRLLGYNTHNNPNGMSGAQIIGSATYTPTLSNLSNFNAGANIYVHNYTRVGNVVSVAGQINIGSPAVAQASLSISLPIPSTFSTGVNGNGTGTFRVGSASTAFALETGASGTTITLIGTPPATGNGLLSYHFQYVVA